MNPFYYIDGFSFQRAIRKVEHAQNFERKHAYFEATSISHSFSVNTLGTAYNEFGYYERLTITSNFFLGKEHF